MVVPAHAPVGYEHLPVTEGFTSDKGTKIEAPATTGRGSVLRYSFTGEFNRKIPYAAKGSGTMTREIHP